MWEICLNQYLHLVKQMPLWLSQGWVTDPVAPSACGFEQHEVGAEAELLPEGLALFLKIGSILRIAAESHRKPVGDQIDLMGMVFNSRWEIEMVTILLPGRNAWPGT